MTSEPLRDEALEAYNRTRGPLPRATRIGVRRNVRRLASLTSRGDGSRALNLAAAVLEAGPEAWIRVAPALGGDREALRRLRELARPGIRRLHRARRGTSRRSLPDTPCEGNDAQREYLHTLVAYVRATSDCADALPTDVQLRISRRMTSSLGLCSWMGTSRRVTIAERLFRPGLGEILFDTVKHELAHLADQVTSRHGRSSHGRRWKKWARRLGARPERLGPVSVARKVATANRKGGHGLPAYPDEVRRWREERSR